MCPLSPFALVFSVLEGVCGFGLGFGVLLCVFKAMAV